VKGLASYLSYLTGTFYAGEQMVSVNTALIIFQTYKRKKL